MVPDAMNSLSKATASLKMVQLDLNTAKANAVIRGTIAEAIVAKAGATIVDVISLLREVQNATQSESGSRSPTIASDESTTRVAATLPILALSTIAPSTEPAITNPIVLTSPPAPSTPSTQKTPSTLPPTAPSTKLDARKRSTPKDNKQQPSAPEQRGFTHIDCAPNCKPSEGEHVWVDKRSGNTCIVYQKPVLCGGCKGKGEAKSTTDG